MAVILARESIARFCRSDYSSAVRQKILHLVEEKHEESWLGRSLKRFFGSTTH